VGKPLLGRNDGRWAVVARYDDPCPEGSIPQGLLIFEEDTPIVFLSPEEFITLHALMVPELWRFLALTLINLDFQETHAAEIASAKTVLRNCSRSITKSITKQEGTTNGK